MDAQLYATLKKAGKVTVLHKQTSSVGKDGKSVVTFDVDAVIVSKQNYCPNTGAVLGSTDVEFSATGLAKDIANAEASLAAMKEMLADLEAA